MPDDPTPSPDGTNTAISPAPAPGSEAPGAPDAPQTDSVDGAGNGQVSDGDAGDGEAPFSWPSAPKAQSDVGSFFEHEAVKPHLEERLTFAREEGEQATLKRLHPLEEKRTQNYQGVVDFTGTFLRGWQKLIKDSAGPEALGEFFEEHQAQFGALGGVHWQEGATFGGSAILADLAKVAGISDEDLAPIADSMKYALQEQIAGRPPDMTFSDRFFKLITKAAVDKNTEEVSQRLGKVADTQREREGRASERKDSPSAADVGGRGSSSPTRYTRDQLSKMTREEIMAIPREERDAAMTASR